MEKESKSLHGLIEWGVILACAAVLALFIRTFVVSPYIVPSGSMEHTIEVGDQLLAQKVSVNLGQPVKSGDIVVFENPEAGADHDVLVKRVIATEGQVVDLKNGRVYVDGEMLEEPYAQGGSFQLYQQAPGIENVYPLTVPKDCVWVMGDNRENSADSRYFGPVERENLIGVVFARYWPIDRIGLM